MYKVVKSSFWFLLFGMLSEVMWIGTVQAISSKQLVIKGDRVFPPYEFINDYGDPDGFNVELIGAVMKEAGLSYELSLEYWPDVVEEYKEGKVDLITGIMYSNRRAQQFKFGAIHAFIYLNVVFRKGSAPISKLKELEGLQVVVQEGAITQEKLKEEVPLAHLIVVPDMNEGLRLLSEGKYDVAMCNQEMARNIIYKQGFSNLDTSELDLSPEEYCFAGNNDSLLKVIDNTFYRLQRNGEYDRIFNKWFSIPAEKGIPQWLYLILGFLILAVATSYLFISLLRKQVKKANKEVKESVKKMRYIFYHSNILMWDFDPSKQIIKLDNGDENSQKMMTIETLLQDRIVHSKQDEVKQFISHLNESSEGNFTTQWELLPLEGSGSSDTRYVIINGMPIRNASGEIIAYSGLRRDITDLIRTQHKLELETERALQSDKLKSAFLANMSHEIRTPLNAIVGFSGLLQEAGDSRERAEYIRIINTNNELLLNLINDILDLSKIESGEVTLNREDFDLATYFTSLAVSLQQRSANPEVQFIIESPYAECKVHLDRSRLAQVCTNFTTNSIKHTQKGYIKIGYAYVDGGIRLYTEDTGSGIPADKQHLVFQRFEKLSPFVQGTGLGLSICKAIVDACGGKIGFTSQERKGSIFWAWIPCKTKIILKE